MTKNLSTNKIIINITRFGFVIFGPLLVLFRVSNAIDGFHFWYIFYNILIAVFGLFLTIVSITIFSRKSISHILIVISHSLLSIFFLYEGIIRKYQEIIALFKDKKYMSIIENYNSSFWFFLSFAFLAIYYILILNKEIYMELNIKKEKNDKQKT